MTTSNRAAVSVLALFTLSIGIVYGGYLALREPAEELGSSVQPAADTETVKAHIIDSFIASPMEFDFEQASNSLAQSRLNGEFAACSSSAEATSAQYIEMSQLVDRYEDMPGLNLALTKALNGNGASDCDYRVFMLLVRERSLQEIGKALTPFVTETTTEKQ